MTRPLILLDFDGVLHVAHEPEASSCYPLGQLVPGAPDFLLRMRDAYRLAVHSPRSTKPDGIANMQQWLTTVLQQAEVPHAARLVYDEIEWPVERPWADIEISARAIPFQGLFPTTVDLARFAPWHSRPTF